jgi:hypothetical protein
MKKFLIALNLVIWSIVGHEVAYAAETTKACVKDAKTGKEVCKQIKVHKKLDVEPAKDAKKK